MKLSEDQRSDLPNAKRPSRLSRAARGIPAMWFSLLTVGVVLGQGCAVYQPRGQGRYEYVQEPSTKAWYHLYLPTDYVMTDGQYPQNEKKLWPLVVAFHGMKPFDSAQAQERAWEKEADNYGYIICAPELYSSDLFMEYPLRQEHSYLLQDKTNVIAIMDHVFSTTRADPKAVLATSWSSGGYLAHYFVNRFPGRFTCLAPSLSNFSSELLDESTVASYRDLPIAIFIGDFDFAACQKESKEAVEWYTARGFRTVHGKMIHNMMHERVPQNAAAFFSEQLGISPLYPLAAAETINRIHTTDYQVSQVSVRSTHNNDDNALLSTYDLDAFPLHVVYDEYQWNPRNSSAGFER